MDLSFNNLMRVLQTPNYQLTPMDHTVIKVWELIAMAVFVLICWMVIYLPTWLQTRKPYQSNKGK